MNALAFLRPSIRVLSVVAVLAASGAGCDTRVLQPHGDGGGPGGGGGLDGTPAQNDGGAAAPVTVPLPAGVTPKPYVSVVHEAGTCDTASDGAPIQTSSAAEVASLLVGRWQICSGSSSSLFL